MNEKKRYYLELKIDPSKQDEFDTMRKLIDIYEKHQDHYLSNLFHAGLEAYARQKISADIMPDIIDDLEGLKKANFTLENKAREEETRARSHRDAWTDACKRVAELESTLKEEENERREAVYTLRRLQGDYGDLKAERDTATAALEDAESRIKQLQGDLDTREAIIQARSTEHADDIKRLREATEAQTRLTLEKNDLESHCAHVKEICEAQTVTISEHAKEINELRRIVAEIEAEREALRDKAGHLLKILATCKTVTDLNDLQKNAAPLADMIAKLERDYGQPETADDPNAGADDPEAERQKMIDDIRYLYAPDAHEDGAGLLWKAYVDTWTAAPLEVLRRLHALNIWKENKS